MPNIATVLKSEILRLARKEVRNELETLKKASAQYRSDIAALKRRVAGLEKNLSRVAKKAVAKTAPADGEAGPRLRFRAKGLATQRKRLGLSAAEMGKLLGVSAQTVYNWETGKSKPRPQQLAAIASVRTLGVRRAKAQLEALEG